MALRVKTGDGDEAIHREFTAGFRIGRGDDCELCIKNEYISRQHAEVVLENGQWWVRDLGSSNGIFIAGEKVQRAPVGEMLTFRLGVRGPFVSLQADKPQPAAQQSLADPPSEGDQTRVERYVKHYFQGAAPNEAAGEHTMFMRRAAAQVQAKSRLKYEALILLLGLAILGAGGYAWHVKKQLEAEKSAAQQLFYTMKTLDLDIGNLQRIIMGSGSQEGMNEIRKDRERRRDLEKNYDRFLSTLNVYDPKMTEKQRLILRVARIFGECELDMPKTFEAEVDRYIQKWQATDRLAIAIHRAQVNGYTKRITEELLGQGLPPQFFYLALQESGFDPFASGPPTSKGIAKGMWQFIPETAVKYDLHLGPLVDLRRPDPGDDRHNYEKETKAAVRYLKDLYCTDAQASGFLVMACYNWGEGRVLPLVRGMPENPRERNFWKLLAKYKDQIPQETYDYVFYIVSAAVIGEDPGRFGFDFENPLAQQLENR